ncbi:hypothetical protein CDD81_7509 [Ophiocordyceps australis]|uniref:Uncharacterized protein n=1 Tax=Ophiocordyceps australis TaxID=1399860 RepID=A0A2C5YHI9_9HYPO|nr:hypothetical protein CDD81_7509 [Ophiocordyceps australis]
MRYHYMHAALQGSSRRPQLSSRTASQSRNVAPHKTAYPVLPQVCLRFALGQAQQRHGDCVASPPGPWHLATTTAPSYAYKMHACIPSTASVHHSNKRVIALTVQKAFCPFSRSASASFAAVPSTMYLDSNRPELARSRAVPATTWMTASALAANKLLGSSQQGYMSTGNQRSSAYLSKALLPVGLSAPQLPSSTPL